jgi:hypothetical protein
MEQEQHLPKKPDKSSKEKKMLRKGWAVYFLGLDGLPLAFASLAGFIGLSQQTSSQLSQPHGSSIKTTRPQSSHLYRSPFFFTKNFAF